MPRMIEADYFVVGAGATGMAFVDTLVTETDATVAIVDRYDQPGGHWTIAYPYVRLHQPSAFYGVNSRVLGGEAVEHAGWNAGLCELAAGSEIVTYLGQVMQQQLLPTGRVSYFPMSEYVGEGRVRSYTGEEIEVVARKRIVDATYIRANVPAMRPPPYEIAGEVRCVPLNALPQIRERHEHYTIVGAGKTGMDACLWLLAHGISPTDLTWIVPRDSWMFDRANIQPGDRFAERVSTSALVQLRAILDATSIDDLFARLVACGRMLRLTDDVRPTMFRCATVSLAEVEQLRGISDIVRLGRLRRITPEQLVLEGGIIPARPGTLYVDCSADGLEKRPVAPIFSDRKITLQTVRTCQPTFSGALIGHVEAAYSDDTTRNDLCHPVPYPDTDLDFLRVGILSGRNQLRWTDDAAMLDWLQRSRLDLWGRLRGPLPTDPLARADAIKKVRPMMVAANEKLASLLEAANLSPDVSCQ